MPLAFGPQSLIHAAEMGITLRGDSRRVIQGMAQARVTSAPHHDLSALATVLGDRGAPALRAQHLIIPFGQGLGGFGKQPGGDLATDPREGLHNRHIGWPPVSSGSSAKVFSNVSPCWAQFWSCLDEVSPKARSVRLVQDNLNTHARASLYEAFHSAEARRLARRLEMATLKTEGARAVKAEEPW